MRKFKVNVNGVSYNVEVQEDGVAVVAAPVAAAAPAAKAAPVEVAAGDTPITAPMPGKVSKVNAKVGDVVKKGDVLMILEAMKMQNEIGSPAAGTVKAINVAKGQSVKPGEVMIILG